MPTRWWLFLSLPLLLLAAVPLFASLTPIASGVAWAAPGTPPAGPDGGATAPVDVPLSVPSPLMVALPTTAPLPVTTPAVPPATDVPPAGTPPPAGTEVAAPGATASAEAPGAETPQPGDPFDAPAVEVATEQPPDIQYPPRDAPTPERRGANLTPTRRGAAGPTRLPTPFNLAPNGEFAVAFTSTSPVAGDRVTLRGKVLDRHKAPLGGMAVHAWNDTTEQTVYTGMEGEYRFVALPPGLYNVEVEGRPGQPAENVQVEARTVTVIEFGEAVPEGGETPEPAVAAGEDPETPAADASGVVTGSLPMGVTPSSGSAANRRAAQPNRDLLSGLLADLPFSFNPDPWLENLLLGAAAAWAIMLLGVAYATLRR